MKTTHTKSVVSDLILACFILSVFLLLENSKEGSTQLNEANTQSEIQDSYDNLKADDKHNSISYILE